MDLNHAQPFAPGDLGVEVQSINGGRVVIMTVKPGSAAEKAGLKPIDFIVSVRPDRPVFCLGIRTLGSLCRSRHGT
jgi:C-terminal processing protease CtpA/Prc